MLPVVLPLLTSAFSSFWAAAAARVIVYKALAVGLVATALPAIAKNLFVWVLNFMNEIVTQQLAEQGGTLSSSVLELTGVGAYLGSTMQLPLCFSIIITAIGIRLTLNFIPFIG